MEMGDDAKPGVVAPSVAVRSPTVMVRTAIYAEPDAELLELASQLGKMPASAAAAHLYEVGYRPTSNARRLVSKPSDDGLRKTQKAMRGKGFSPGSIYEQACRCDSRASELRVSAGVYKALKDLVERYGAQPKPEHSGRGKGSAA